MRRNVDVQSFTQLKIQVRQHEKYFLKGEETCNNHHSHFWPIVNDMAFYTACITRLSKRKV